ncbi:AGAP009015-PA [Sergentomyia squamirostris]
MQQTQVNASAIMNHKSPGGDIATATTTSAANTDRATNNNNNNITKKTNSNITNNNTVNLADVNVSSVVVKSASPTGNGKTSQEAPTPPDARAKQVLKEAVDAVVNSFAKHTQGYGRETTNFMYREAAEIERKRPGILAILANIRRALLGD